MTFFGRSNLVQQNTAKGLEYFARACDLGNGPSCSYLAALYCGGGTDLRADIQVAVPFDLTRALYFADKGCTEAHYATACQQGAADRANPSANCYESPEHAAARLDAERLNDISRPSQLPGETPLYNDMTSQLMRTPYQLALVLEQIRLTPTQAVHKTPREKAAILERLNFSKVSLVKSVCAQEKAFATQHSCTRTQVIQTANRLCENEPPELLLHDQPVDTKASCKQAYAVSCP
jgi:hypothetical protein